MAIMNNAENVQCQYASDANLSIRVRLHKEYSTSTLDFASWLFKHYVFSKGDRILELGCGNGWQWEGRVDTLPAGCTLVLTDLSMGMVNAVWEKYGKNVYVLTQRLDIQDMPFPNDSFDILIANHMLYHVPDLERALTEAHRVLRQGGKFYAATNGNGGMRLYLHDALKALNPKIDAFGTAFPFNLQNGGEMLHRHFSKVERRDFEDSLRVTHTEDLVNWIRSTVAISDVAEYDLDGLFEYFEAIRMRDGAIHIPKESGLFIATK